MLSVTVFLLTAVPKLNMKIGPVPLYVMDLFLASTYVLSLRVPRITGFRVPFAEIVTAILFIAMASELLAFIRLDGVFESFYLLFRTVLAFSIFFSVSRIVNDQESIVTVLKAGVLGISVTVLLMILSSLPMTRGIVSALVFSHSFLEPSAKGLIERSDLYSMLELGGTRGRSLIGVSILSGAFINVFWPMVIFLFYRQGIGRSWKWIAFVVMLLAPYAVVMSYSRGSLIGMFLVVAGIVLAGSSRYKVQVLASLSIAYLVFSSVGWQSDMFFFDRYERKFTAMSEDPYKDAGDQERAFAYFEPFEHLMQRPDFFFIGEGVTVREVSAGKPSEQADKATHALFAIAYYSYGMIAALLYIMLIARGFLLLLRYMKQYRYTEPLAVRFSGALFAGLLGMTSWFLFGHAAVSTPRGATLFFLLFGFISSLQNFTGGEPVQPINRSDRQ